MVVVSFIAMYVLMYAMVDTLGNVYANINQLYMAGLMTAAMVVIELLCMKAMYANRKKNIFIIGVSIFVLVISWGGIRGQVAIGDKQFLESMIPHHASALLMCEKAPIADLEIKTLCDGILVGQQQEIDQMKTILERMQ